LGQENNNVCETNSFDCHVVGGVSQKKHTVEKQQKLGRKTEQPNSSVSVRECDRHAVILCTSVTCVSRFHIHESVPAETITFICSLFKPMSKTLFNFLASSNPQLVCLHCKFICVCT